MRPAGKNVAEKPAKGVAHLFSFLNHLNQNCYNTFQFSVNYSAGSGRSLNE